MRLSIKIPINIKVCMVTEMIFELIELLREKK